MTRLDRRTLYRAKWEGLVRLAKYLGLSVSDEPETVESRKKFVETMVRKMDANE